MNDFVFCLKIASLIKEYQIPASGSSGVIRWKDQTRSMEANYRFVGDQNAHQIEVRVQSEFLTFNQQIHFWNDEQYRQWYFICPGLSECGRRVAKLYLPAQGKSFACLACHQMKISYSSKPSNILETSE